MSWKANYGSAMKQSTCMSMRTNVMEATCVGICVAKNPAASVMQAGKSDVA